MKIICYAVVGIIMQSMVSCYMLQQNKAAKSQPFKPHKETKMKHKKHH
jgi:hypothetical protein